MGHAQRSHGHEEIAMTKPDKTKTDKIEYQIDVADHPSVSLWMKEAAKKDPEGFLRLVGPNEKQLVRIFGPADWRNDGEKGWTHAWSVYDNSLHWLVLTGPQGTLFRLRLPVPGDSYLSDSRVGVGIVQYLQNLLKILAN